MLLSDASFRMLEGREDGPAAAFGRNSDSESLRPLGRGGGTGTPAIKSAIAFSASFVSSGKLAAQLGRRRRLFAKLMNLSVLAALGKRWRIYIMPN